MAEVEGSREGDNPSTDASGDYVYKPDVDPGMGGLELEIITDQDSASSSETVLIESGFLPSQSDHPPFVPQRCGTDLVSCFK